MYMNELGYFIFMSEQEAKELQCDDSEDTNDNATDIDINKQSVEIKAIL